MNHPDELLADLVDSSLSPSDRAVVEAHLASCARCRQEFDLASAAKRALTSLPEEPVPAHVAESVLTAAAAAPSRAPLWYRWAGAAAAAAVIAILAITLPRIGSSGDMATAERSAAPATSPSALVLEISRDQLNQRKLTDAAVNAEASATPGAEGSVTDPAAAFSTADLSIARTAPARTSAALSCLQRAFGPAATNPYRLVEARYDSARAYLGFYLEGPGAGLEPDTSTVRVAAVRGCAALTTTSARLNP